MKKILFFLLLCTACYAESDKNIHPQGMTIETRFLPPKGYSRIPVQRNSFARYLRSLPLKPHNSSVRYYDGTIKQNNGIYDAVIDLPIGKKDLHQCADAIMRLRAEYFWQQGKYDAIHFNFTNGFRADYSEWMKGRRIKVKGNTVWWNNRTAPSNTYEDFWQYLEYIFMYAGTASLSKEMHRIDIQKMQIGDVFIIGGHPGHAVLIVDIAKNKENNIAFMLAQSYMPAQEMHILKNPQQQALSPWYLLDDSEKLYTPEWTFKKTDLKRF